MRELFPDIFPPLFRGGNISAARHRDMFPRRPHPEGVSRGNILSLGVWEMFPGYIFPWLK